MQKFQQHFTHLHYLKKNKKVLKDKARLKED